MSFTRRISEYRSTILLTVLVVLSFASLASGTRASILTDGLRTVVSVVAYPFLKVLGAVESGAYYVTGLVIDYGAGRAEADALRRQVNLLVQRDAEREELQAENRRLARMLGLVRREPRLTLQPARIVERFPGEIIGRFEGTLIIDQGSAHGVEEFMCAITPDSVVGVVTRVEPFQSYVHTLHHADCKVGAMVRRNRVRGIVHGSGSDLSRICTMRYLDVKDDVRVGDEVITGGGGVFPSGYPIGTITVVHDTNSLLRTAYVEPAADPYRIDEVFIVRAAVASADELAGPASAASAGSLAHPMPDERPLQERFAP